MADPQTTLHDLLAALRNSPAMLAKQAIGQAAAAQPSQGASGDDLYALPGDDTAAIRCGDQYQLLAIEGMIPAFVEQAPWFAGWSAVMANVSDITAMGGAPLPWSMPIGTMTNRPPTACWPVSVTPARPTA